MPILDAYRRKSADDGTGGNVAHDAALGSDLRARSNGEVIGNAGLPAHHHAIADDRAAGDADLSADHAVAA